MFALHFLVKEEVAPPPKHESRWPNFVHGLLIYIYLEDGITKLHQTTQEGVFYWCGGINPQQQGLTFQNIATIIGLNTFNGLTFILFWNDFEKV